MIKGIVDFGLKNPLIVLCLLLALQSCASPQPALHPGQDPVVVANVVAQQGNLSRDALPLKPDDGDGADDGVVRKAVSVRGLDGEAVLDEHDARRRAVVVGQQRRYRRRIVSHVRQRLGRQDNVVPAAGRRRCSPGCRCRPWSRRRYL